MATNARKYTPEQIAAELARPKARKGRPRKYATEEERKRARTEAAMRTYWRKKNARAGIVDESDALQKRTLATDEERAQTRRETALRLFYEHQDDRNLHRAALRASLV